MKTTTSPTPDSPLGGERRKQPVVNVLQLRITNVPAAIKSMAIGVCM
ncbi:MAG: hypothetical protein NTV94_04445 [Planctomycetota bacterium]|nr:hypothetical protein [Planctomycetota bacterium]